MCVWGPSAQDACGAQVPKLRGEQKYAAFTAIARAALPFKTEQHKSRDMFGSLFSLLRFDNKQTLRSPKTCQKNTGLFRKFSQMVNTPPPFWEPLVQEKYNCL